MHTLLPSDSQPEMLGQGHRTELAQRGKSEYYKEKMKPIKLFGTRYMFPERMSLSVNACV